MTDTVVIGGGPAGLMAAESATSQGLQVHLFEAMPSVGRKLLVAGSSGLNLTRNESLEQFLDRYGERRAQLEPIIRDFGPHRIREWAHELGIKTFIGSSGKIFPEGMKSAALLKTWKDRLRNSGVQIHLRYRWTGWDENNVLVFDTPSGEQTILASTIILALGGGSWPQLGSTGGWVPILQEKGIPIQPLRPSNCGFNVQWSEQFSTRFEGAPVKPVTIHFTNSMGQQFHQNGEFVVTKYGLEGSSIYALSAPLRREIEENGPAGIELDLAPDWPLERLVERLARPRGSNSISNHLRKSVGIQGVKGSLLREFVPQPDFSQPQKLAAAIKALPVQLASPRPLEEAISSAGGVDFTALDENLMLHSLPGVFCAGEMLDWEAPTGGYLLTACLASGHRAGFGAANWLKGSAG